LEQVPQEKGHDSETPLVLHRAVFCFTQLQFLKRFRPFTLTLNFSVESTQSFETVGDRIGVSVGVGDVGVGGVGDPPVLNVVVHSLGLFGS
jgi:hypothetical protein